MHYFASKRNAIAREWAHNASRAMLTDHSGRCTSIAEHQQYRALNAKKQQGFSLVDCMIALSLLLVILSQMQWVHSHIQTALERAEQQKYHYWRFNALFQSIKVGAQPSNHASVSTSSQTLIPNKISINSDLTSNNVLNNTPLIGSRGVSAATNDYDHNDKPAILPTQNHHANDANASSLDESSYFNALTGHTRSSFERQLNSLWSDATAQELDHINAHTQIHISSSGAVLKLNEDVDKVNHHPAFVRLF